MAIDDVASLTKKVESVLEQVRTFGVSDEEHLRQLAAPIAAAGMESFVGRVAFAGQRSSGSYSVQFNADGGSGYSSQWPEWAFNQAQVALLHGKKLWVISNGSPFGNNLLTVLVLSTSV